MQGHDTNTDTETFTLGRQLRLQIFVDVLMAIKKTFISTFHNNQLTQQNTHFSFSWILKLDFFET